MMKELNKMVPLRDLVLFLDEKIGIAQDLVNEVEGETQTAASQSLYTLLVLYYELSQKFSNIGDE